MSTSMANRACCRYIQEGIVCTTNLSHNVFTLSAVDNSVDQKIHFMEPAYCLSNIFHRMFEGFLFKHLTNLKLFCNTFKPES